jgi:hypothetical protein
MVSAIGLRSRKHEVCRTHEERFPLACSPPTDAGKGNNAVVRGTRPVQQAPGTPVRVLARWDLEKRALAQVPGSKVEVRIAAITRSARYAEKLSFLREG